MDDREWELRAGAYCLISVVLFALMSYNSLNDGMSYTT